MNEYYTMESIRELIVDRYEVRSAKDSLIRMPSWNRYPYPTIKLCKQRNNTMCIGYVSIFINTETVRWLFLEICFFRLLERAFIRIDSLSMLKLFELGIIAREQPLATVRI
jgi:hypothetical protein